ncbi:MAG: glutamine--fructose-6-phosphate transaminase (isomerizing) [Verrucomicrobiae bacterium]|nr:glutamine--fructose-6-phosphate transaminase (isomerizing) [Verrucomicrobiae bacterium]
MCGIIGYVGVRAAAPILLEGLRRLEYRGYDSAGAAVINNGKFDFHKKKGKIDDGLSKLMSEKPLCGNIGIGHTRWATHGAPSDINSHPHFDHSKTIAVVHNGVIENYDRLKQKLKDHVFESETDTEVLAHLIGEHYERLKEKNCAASDSCVSNENTLTKAVIEALKEVIGTYGIAVISKDFPNVIVTARRGSPIIIGVGDNEHFVASDAVAIAPYTRNVVYLNDYDVATITSSGIRLHNLGSDTAKIQINKLELDPEAAERGEFPHFMLKEIFEQPKTIRNAMRGRINFEEGTATFGGLNMTMTELRAIDRIVMPACGTSWHAALIGEHYFEEFANIPSEVEYASEFRYRNSPLEKNTLVLIITQSGETADSLAGLREAKRRGHKVLSICNVVGSTIAREADGGIYLHAGPEIGVASTKAFTSQITVLALFGVLMGRIRNLSLNRALQTLKALENVPDQVESILAQSEKIKKIALEYAWAEDFFFLGRQYNFPVALEGALKLKEISYIHAEGYPAAEMKHGPIAMIDEKTPTVFIIPKDSLYEKNLSNLQEIKARKGPIIAITTEDNREIEKLVNHAIYLPQTEEPLFPLLAAIPLQLIAYYIAVERGCDVDKPRNLAKSVTVE